MMHLRNWTLPLVALASLLPTAAYAQGKLPPAAEASSPAPALPAGQAGAPEKSSDGLFIKTDSLQPVYFAGGLSKLDEQTLPLAKQNVDWLKLNLPLHILVAGHSDGRGSPEQNLAMGQRRAAALRDFYVAMGIPRSRISTVSYGQEEPACFEATEECQMKNRRADTLVENKDLAAR